MKLVPDVTKELNGVPLKVEGRVPEWLHGTLIRNGPVDFELNGQRPTHWFDGLAMLHAFSFDRGRVSYSNRFLRTDAYREVFERGKMDYNGFASDPCRSLFKRFFTHFFPRKHSLPNANVNVAKLAEHYVALTEIPLSVRFDPKTLETLGVVDFQDQLPHGNCWESAHPHVEGNMAINYLIDYGHKSSYNIYTVGQKAEQHLFAKIPVEEPAYMHSFALTENFVILVEFPLVVKPLDLLVKGRAFIHNFQWKPERGTRFLVIDRKSGKVVSAPTTKPFFAFHHANGYEENGR